MKTLIKTSITFLLLSIVACKKENAELPAVSDLNSSNTTEAFYIGKSYHGGFIFYIDKSGQHGLIVSKADLLASNSSTQISWNNGRNKITNATDVAVGSGLANTQKIVTAQGNTGDYAALLCYNYKTGIYKDWYLPSKNELNLLYQQQAVIGAFGQYWSSSEVNKSKAWDQVFGGGFKEKDRKSFTLNVRAISSF